jgi:hypothetical protein
MANKNIQIKLKNGATWDDLFPRTKTAIVLLDDGITSLSTKLTNIDTSIAGKVGMTEVNNAIATVIGTAPDALNTLDELAQALGDDANFASTVTTSLTSKAPLASPTFTGVPAVPTAVADTTTTQVASTAFVVGQASSTAPVIDGTATVGTSKKFARADHIHPIDTSRAPISAPTFTGVPSAPTAISGTNTTQIATTAFVKVACDAVALTSPVISATEPTTSNLWYQEI